MNAQAAAAFAQVLAAQARILGMQAENNARAARGDAPAYDEAPFMQEASYMDTLSVQIRNSQ